MTAAAYAYVDGGIPSKEMQLLVYLDRFGGAINVLGRPLGASEIRRMMVADSIYKWYQERGNALNITEWTASNPQKADRLHEAYKLAKDLNLIEE